MRNYNYTIRNFKFKKNDVYYLVVLEMKHSKEQIKISLLLNAFFKADI
jgi:hypothetical protein